MLLVPGTRGWPAQIDPGRFTRPNLHDLEGHLAWGQHAMPLTDHFRAPESEQSANEAIASLESIVWWVRAFICVGVVLLAARRLAMPTTKKARDHEL